MSAKAPGPRLGTLVLLAAGRLGVDDTYKTGPNARASGGRFGGWSIRNRVDSDTRGLRIKFKGESKIFDMQTAALWLLLLGLPEVAVTCPDCLARGAGGKLARWEWCHRLEHRCAIVVSLMAQGWTVGWTAKRTSGFDIVACRPCPTCTVDGAPTGKVTREPARLFLDAMPTEGTPPNRGHDVQTRDVEPPPGVTLGPGQRWVQDVHPRARGLDFPIELASPGDPVARERLSVLADELQASGNPRGEWLALWLRGAVETEAGHSMPIDTALPAIAAELRELQ